MKLSILTMIVALLLLLAALGGPLLLRKDQDAGITPLQAELMKSEARHASKIPPLMLQITDVVPSPEEADSQALPNGTVVWRTVFGVKYGETEISNGQSHTDFQNAKLLIAWSLFLISELALIGIVLLRLRREA